MEEVKRLMTAMGALPKLRLGEKLKGGGVKSYGPKEVKFLKEPEGVTIKKMGKQVKALRFEVEHNKTRYFWYVPVLNQEGQPNYLLERTVEIKVGDVRVLEMSKQGAINYIDIREVGAPARAPEEDEAEDVIDYGDEAAAAGAL